MAAGFKRNPEAESGVREFDSPLWLYNFFKNFSGML